MSSTDESSGESTTTAESPLASHERNVAYYSKATTEFLKRSLPRARVDVADTQLRLAAIEQVLRERGEL